MSNNFFREIFGKRVWNFGFPCPNYQKHAKSNSKPQV